ncbi:MAG: SDR family NAD(P)-dependent oxidoreductase [Phycisphaerales bacterium]|nr:SDR family NAD(P)-dependent oxidoreductase [Phycisphaerales bacterium]
MRRDLTDQVAVITGASSGIGAATARAMAAAGIDVVLVARRRDKLDQVASEVRALGRRAHVIVADVADGGHVDRILDETDRVFGHFDIVFANAGYGMERPMHETSNEEVRRMFEVNFFASVALLQAAANRLQRARRGGHLLMCSSCVSKFALPGHGLYAATKAAQESVCRAMRFELAPDNIEVASVHPITTTSEFFDTSAARSGLRGGSIPAHTPRWFVQSPERVAKAIVACLRRPRSEVWTSTIVRLSAALFTAVPFALDLVLRREAKRQRVVRARVAAIGATAIQTPANGYSSSVHNRRS